MGHLFFSIILFILILLPLISSELVYDNPNLPKLNSPEVSGVESINYSTVNVNNSQYLQGYTWTTNPYYQFWYNMTVPFTNWLSSFVYDYNQTTPAIDYVNENFYDKSQVDTNLSYYLLLTDQRYNDTSYINSLITNYYTKGEIEVLLLNSSNVTVDLSAYYNVTEMDKILNNYYNKSEIDNNFSLYLLTTDQRYNETDLINSVNTTVNIQSLGFYNSSEVDELMQGFNGTTLILDINTTLWDYITNNEASWLSTYNETYATWAYNQTYTGGFYNETYNTWAYNMSDGNNVYTHLSNFTDDIEATSTYNETYATWAYNQSDGSYNETYATWAYNQTYTGGTYNETYAMWAYNQTYAGGFYNETYNTWAYNQSITYTAGSNITIDGTVISLDTANTLSWLETIFIKFADVVGLVGNWSADKVNYYNTTQTDEIIASVNDSTYKLDGSKQMTYFNSSMGVMYNNGTDNIWDFS